VFVNQDTRGASKHRIESPPTVPAGKKPRSDLDKLDLLCQAMLEIGPMHENPAGCTCPKSKCIALYCDCFKAGRRCNPKSCGCVDCKNTVAESGPDGARTRAIRSILARNPRAFVTAGMGNPPRLAAPGESLCNCIRSKCLKLYCTCFQAGKVCTDSCTCVGCANTDGDATGERRLAIQLCLEKRPDAFGTRVREPGLGCACKNNRCVRKYCECFRTGLSCSKRCSCRQCENRSSSDNEDDDGGGGEEKKFCS
jgi:Tesmin/TSO1-like CXC domain, cysteine-rich domain